MGGIQQRGDENRGRWGVMVRAGVILVVGVGLVLSPLVVRDFEPMKYVVVVGFLMSCWGVSSMINGAWDLWRK